MMAELGEFTINVKLNIDKETAVTCLKIVELYVNQNDVRVIADTNEDGSLRFHFENKAERW